VLLVDGDGILRYAGPAAERLLGFELSGDLAGDARLVDAIHPDDYGLVVERLHATFAGAGAVEPVEIRVRAADGAWRWLEIRATNLTHDPDVSGVVVNGHDVTERKRADALLAAELDVLERMAVSESVTPVLRRIAEVIEEFIPACRASVGAIDADGVVRHPAAPSLPASVIALLDAERPDGELGRLVRERTDWMVAHDITTDPRWGAMGPIARRHGLRSCWWFPVHGADDALLGVVTIFAGAPRGPHPSELPLLDRLRHLASLALDRHRFERRLRDQAVQDALTGLPNRTLLVDRVTKALELGDRRGTHTAVLFVDLDRFKVVNDGLGHVKGDRLLRQVAARLAGAVRRGDTVGRFGGDEFLVVAEDVAGETGAVHAAERLMLALAEPFDLDGSEVVISASIGIALAGPGADAVGADSLVRNADAAMYRAKDSGRNRVAVFEDTLHAELLRRYELEQGLRGAVDRGELVVLYQPRVRLADGRLTGVEALVRWDRPGEARIGADEMIPIAEDTGHIVAIGARVLRDACWQAVAWDADPVLAGLCVAVNLSARQLGDPGLVDVVAATLAETGLSPERLCLEVTESALARDPDAAAAVLSSLKGLGVRLAIDDFGTGYATLDYVRRFSMADELKIDRSFVAGLGDLHSSDAAIVSAAIVLADALGFETVAEGVETPEQLAVLRRLGCASAQGWYFGRPVEPEGLREALA
jgi:diguanylate cyclase (GGDEF)-like protein/PAS domain S-box-containing protein